VQTALAASKIREVEEAVAEEVLQSIELGELVPMPRIQKVQTT
jgi:hypothetical protein